MDLKSTGLTVLLWLLGALVAYSAVGVFADGLWHGGPFVLMAALVCLPPLRSYVVRKTGVHLHGAVYVIAFFALLGVGMNLASSQHEKQARDQEQAAQAAMKKRVADKLAAAETEFRENKTAILIEARRLFDAGDHAGVLASVSRFARIGDPDLARIRDKSSLIVLRKELEQSPTEARQSAIYSEIARLDPTDTEAKSEASEIQSRLAAERARVARKQGREEQIRRQFNAWDGSHTAVERAIKAQMKNPDSYQHVETRFVDSGGENFMVFTKFRGTNSFNAVVPNTAVASVSSEGRVVTLRIE